MPVYSSSISRAGVNVANTAYWQLIPSATVRLRVREIGLFVNTAPTTAPNFALIRSTALGTATTTTAGVAHSPSVPASAGALQSAWSVAPTFSTTGPNLRQVNLPVTAGAGVIWSFPADQAVELLASTAVGLVLFNINASGATTGNFTAYFTWEE